jgi:membrane protease YdiL (CAAX protease family)
MKPVLKAVLFTFVPLLFAAAAGIIISIKALNENQAIIAQTAAFCASILIGLIILRKSGFTLTETGFKKLEYNTVKAALYFIPLIIMETLPFFTGLNENNNGLRIVLLVFFTIIVGINEELYFRGIILNLFKKDNVVRGIIISSILFGIGHTANALAGKNWDYIAAQVIFAFLFGIMAAEIVIITKSIFPVILIHAIHDFVSNITNDGVQNGIPLIILIIQIVILIVYVIIMFKKIKQNNGVRPNSI